MPELRSLVERVLDGEGADPRAVVEIVLLRDRPMAALNATYRDRRGPTDVLSFPTDASCWPDDEPRVLGSVVVSVDRAVAQAAQRRRPVARELAQLVAHGVLHLMGYRDDTAAGRQRMRRREHHYLRPRRGAR